MVCIRCEMVVKAELEKVGIPFFSVKIGEVEMKMALTAKQREQLNAALKTAGLELLDDKKSMLVEKIKQVIIELVHYTEDRIRVNLSDHLREALGYDYTYLANLFSEVKGTTIEQFFIFHRIERAKELLVYDELNLAEIADKLHFSSAAHLSRQFKKVTGLTPSYFKKLKNNRRGSIDNV
jgi:AraC-like DNA-binding protein